MTAILNLSTVAVVWFGAIRVDSGAMPIGNLTAFLQYLMQILFAVLMAVFMFILVPRAAVSAGRIQEVLQTEPAIRDPADAGHADPDRSDPGLVEFRDVEFRYPGAEEPVLHGISFTARPGETTAIVGSTGSGKTTLVNLIPRFYDVTGGAVLVDGVDVRAMDREDLWRAHRVHPAEGVPVQRHGRQQPALRRRRTRPTSELWKALEIAQGRDFVEEMEGGLEAPITQGGTNVSGGQRQRLAIARALVKRAPDLHLRRQLLGARLRDRRAAAGRPRARARRRDGDHRRPARRHDHEGRPDRRHGRRPGGRDRHAHGAAGDQRDLPRDRLLAALRPRRPRHERADRAAAARRGRPTAGSTGRAGRAVRAAAAARG